MKNRLLNTYEEHSTWLHFNMVFIYKCASKNLYLLHIEDAVPREFLFHSLSMFTAPKCYKWEIYVKIMDIEFMEERFYIPHSCPSFLFLSLSLSLLLWLSSSLALTICHCRQRNAFKNECFDLGHGKWCDKRRVILNRMACVGAWHRIQIARYDYIRYTQIVHMKLVTTIILLIVFFLFGLNLDIFLVIWLSYIELDILRISKSTPILFQNQESKKRQKYWIRLLNAVCVDSFFSDWAPSTRSELVFDVE